MAPETRAYVLKETMISIVINALLSALFVWLVFGGLDAVPVWSRGGLAADFVPQTFMISLMSVLVPSLLTRKRRRAGEVAGCRPMLGWLPRNILLRALILAAASTLILGGAAMLALTSAAAGAVTMTAVWPMKVIYGALLAVIVTPIGLCAALGEEVRAK